MADEVNINQCFPQNNIIQKLSIHSLIIVGEIIQIYCIIKMTLY